MSQRVCSKFYLKWLVLVLFIVAPCLVLLYTSWSPRLAKTSNVSTDTGRLHHQLFSTGLLRRQAQAAATQDGTWRITTNDSNDDNGFLIPSDDVLRSMTEQRLTLLYWRYVNTLQVLCRNTIRHGLLGDGGKEVCIDDYIVPKKPCLVYSFGSQFQFDFEYSIIQVYGCEVHTFDPSIRIDSSNRHRIPPFVNYHEIGLDGRDHVTRGGWTMRTLPSIIQMLGHENRVIDILKIDAEGGEWSGFQSPIHFEPLANVKQLLVELHFGAKGRDGDDYWGDVATERQLGVLRALHGRGFRIFMREHTMSYVKNIRTVYGPQLCSINELSLINVNWKT